MPLHMFQRDVQPCFAAGHTPRLVFVSRAESTYSQMARLLHRSDTLIEIAYIYEGSGTHLVGNHSYAGRKGDLLVYNAGVVHDDTSLPNTVERMYCLGFTGLQLDGLPPNHLIGPDMPARMHAGKYENEIEMLFRSILMQMEQQHDLAEEFCNAALCTILLLLRQLLSETRADMPQEHELVGSMKAYIDQNYAEALTLGGLAETFYINPYYASHIFKAVMGYSPIQYITRRRIGEAQNLLIFTSSSVTQIAAMIGYDNPNYFSTVFNKLVGMSPIRYRQNWRI